MNPPADQHSDVDTIDALLTAPIVPELAAAREVQLRRFVVDETRSRRRDRLRRRHRSVMPLFAIGAAAAAAVVVAVASGSHPTRPASAQAMTVPIDSPTGIAAGPTLREVADVVAGQPPLAPGPRQFAYIETIGAFTSPTQQRTFDGPVHRDQITKRQLWLAQTPTADHAHGSGVAIDGVSRHEYDLGSIRTGGRTVTLTGTGAPVPSYRTLAGYPTSPSALLDRIRATLRRNGTRPTAAAEFDELGQLLNEAIEPPAVEATLYRAAARVPGVTLVRSATDAAGRAGFAVALTSGAVRSEWIFDRTTKTYLGERDYLVRASSAGRRGTLVGTTAVLRRAVVDRSGEIPHT